jgi:hypothetical protein
MEKGFREKTVARGKEGKESFCSQPKQVCPISPSLQRKPSCRKYGKEGVPILWAGPLLDPQNPNLEGGALQCLDKISSSPGY